MKTSIKLIFILFTYTSVISCQDFGKMHFMANLPRVLAEASGNEMLPGSDLIYLINDGGNPNHVYAVDSLGDIKREIIIENAQNKDWEDLASDSLGTLYIGDFGNNENSRDELTIYAVSGLADMRKEIDTAFAKTTTFTLSDRDGSGKRNRSNNFDIEAFIQFKGNFYLFSKNRDKDFDGSTKVYRLPAKPGKATAEKIASHIMCGDWKDCFVTAAAVSPSGNKIALLTPNKVFMLSGFEGDDFFGGKVEKIELKDESQKEGVCFKGENTLIITDERRAQTGGNMYSFQIN